MTPIVHISTIFSMCKALGPHVNLNLTRGFEQVVSELEHWLADV